MGDFNIANERLDIYDFLDLNHEPGFTCWERYSFSKWIQGKVNATSHVDSEKLIDAFRYMYPEKVQYTWWSPDVEGSKKKNWGWRRDLALVSERIKLLVKDVIIYDYMKLNGSSHCPIELKLRDTDMDLEEVYRLNQS